MPAPAAPASLRPSATRELSEPRRTQVKRSWIQGLSKGPSLWQVLQQRLCHKEESRPTTRRGTSPDGKADEVTGKMSLEELGKYICSDLERRFGCLEVAAAYAALSMEMCSEQEIDTFLATVEDGERGIRLAPMVAAATLPAISFGAQGFEDRDVSLGENSAILWSLRSFKNNLDWTMNLSNPPFTRHEIFVVDLLQSCPRHFPVCSLLAADWHAQTAGCSGEQELLAR
eukprot:symbB.v1.2.001371.t1/scaffold71.1/size352893/14